MINIRVWYSISWAFSSITKIITIFSNTISRIVIYFTFAIVTLPIVNKPLTIINGYTQYDFRGRGPKVNYDAIRELFRKLKIENRNIFFIIKKYFEK